MNVGDLTAKLKLDTTSFEKDTEKVNGMSNNLVKGVGKVLGGVATATVAAVGAAAAGIASMVKESVSAFADYEQLVGGVETLFKDSAGIVEDYALDAYKTAGLSANEYMEQVTSFSASLLQSLGGDTEKAAEVANMAIIDMADNANKMGTSIESIQNAYQGFAKQNYTMLDNLKLGYGGTREEMLRLLADAEKLTGIHYDISNLNDVYQAIHAIQEEMGITGTTAEEAASTISGSWAMVQAAWDNLLVSIAGGGAGLKESIGAFVESVTAWFSNLIPVIQEALYGIGDLILGLAPVIVNALPELVSNVLPGLLDATLLLVDKVVITLMTEGIPLLIDTAIKMVLALAESFTNNIDKVIAAFANMLVQIVELIVINLPTLITAGLNMILALVEGIMNNQEQVFRALTELIIGGVATLLYHLPEFLMIGFKIVLTIIEGILMAIPNLIKALLQVFGIIEDTTTQSNASLEGIESKATETANTIESSMTSIRGLTSTAETEVKSGTEKMASDVKSSEMLIYDAAGRVTGTVKDLGNGLYVWAEGSMKTLKDINGNVVGQYKTGTKEIAAMTSNTQGTVETSMGSIATSADRAATAVENAANRMNAALGSISGGTIDIGARASGGPVSAGMPYMTGEEGRELYIPAQNGYVLNHKDTEEFLDDYTGSRGGGIVINIQGDVYDDEISMRRKISSAVLDVIQTELSYG